MRSTGISERASPPTEGRRWPSVGEWLYFTTQFALIAIVQGSDDLIRGNLWPPNISEAIRHAQQVVAFETAHGFFVEPAWQLFFEHTHRVLGVLITWPDVFQVANGIYEFCHLLIPIAVGIWVFVCHRHHFTFLRNVTLFTCILSVIGYEVYPMAPPRLTIGLTFNHHPFQFQDTLYSLLGKGRLGGTTFGYNPVSAMPSLHFALALIMGVTILLLARHPLVRAMGVLYPPLMLFAIVISGNHYFLDAAGATLAVLLATVLAIGVERARRRWRVAIRLPRLAFRIKLPRTTKPEAAVGADRKSLHI
jgi:hypothetical protein